MDETYSRRHINMIIIAMSDPRNILSGPGAGYICHYIVAV